MITYLITCLSNCTEIGQVLRNRAIRATSRGQGRQTKHTFVELVNAEVFDNDESRYHA